jgi:NAD(P)-dependent dehydrogenase (short-subunit alcohol dehydrogenase family)
MLKDKIVVIIGGVGFIGQEFVKSCLENRAKVVVSDIVEDMGFRIEDLGLNGKEELVYKRCDITSKNSVLDLIKFTKDKFNKIDVVVNTAYPRNKNYGRKFEKVEYEDFCENVNLHLGGYFLVSQQFAEFFKKQNFGNIINIASIYGIIPPRFEIYENTEMTTPIEYNVIKHSIVSMTKYIAKYYKGFNIRANCISPGGILNNQSQEFLDKYNKFSLNKGMLERKDISGTLLFLISDMSKYVNGQNIIVDDGWSL